MTYYKNKRKKENNRKLLIVIIFTLLFHFSFNLGKSKTQGNLNFCKSQVSKAENEKDKFLKEKIKLQQVIGKLQIEKSLLDEKYTNLVGSEDSLSLFNDINEQIKIGIEIPRISRVVKALKRDRMCSKPVIKRFIVKTPLYKGDIKNTNVSFEKGVFDITADGYSFINDSHKPESWFNPEKEISLNFNTKKGIEVVKKLLPIEKSIVLSNKEYFFKIEESDTTGFINVIEHSCNYP